MSNDRIRTNDGGAFVLCLVFNLLGVLIVALGISNTLPPDCLLWRCLGTCGILFNGSMFSSMAIRFFKTNQ